MSRSSGSPTDLREFSLYGFMHLEHVDWVGRTVDWESWMVSLCQIVGPSGTNNACIALEGDLGALVQKCRSLAHGRTAIVIGLHFLGSSHAGGRSRKLRPLCFALGLCTFVQASIQCKRCTSPI